MIAVWAQAADLWGESLGRATWQGAIVLAAAWAIARWCTFLSPRVICWVWRLACLKLLVALFWGPPIELAVLPAAVPTAPMFNAISSQPLRDDAPLAMNPAIAPTPASPAAPAYKSLTASQLLLPLWVLGVGYCMSRTGAQWIAIRRRLRADVTYVTPPLAQICAAEARRLGLRKTPRLGFSTQFKSPILTGVLRPVILLPRDCESTFDTTELRMMLAHELMHLRRRDLAWNWLPTVATWLFYFHPLVWLMTRRWSESQEAACDEALIQAHVARPVEYGRLLLKLAALAPRERSPGLATAGVLGAYRNLERRILTMNRVRPFSARRVALAACALSLMALIVVIPWRLVAQEPAQKTPLATKNESKEPKVTATVEPTFVYENEFVHTEKLATDSKTQKIYERLKELGATPVGGEMIGFQSGWKGTDADLVLLNDIPKIKTLYIEFETVGAKAIGELKLQHPVENLILFGATDDNLAEMGRLPRCGRLTLITYALTEKGFGLLAKLSQGINFLEFNGAGGSQDPDSPAGGVTNEALRHISQISSLTGLQLFQGSFSDEGLGRLAALDKLEELNLILCKNVRGPGFARLAPIKSLRRIWLLDQPLDGEAFKSMATLRQLESLRLRPDKESIAKLTPSDMGALKAFTNLKVLEFGSFSDKQSEPLGSAIIMAAAQAPELTSLRLYELAVSSESIDALAKAPHLKELHLLSSGSLEPLALALGRMTHLDSLHLHGRGPVSVTAIKALAGLRSLTRLFITGSDLNDEGLKELAALDGLVSLGLPGSRITGAGLPALARLNSLRELNLASSPLDDAGAANFRDLLNVVQLDLSNTRITDKAIGPIAAMPNLKKLVVDGNSVTFAGLMPLQDAKQLRVLSAKKIAKATKEEFLQLQEALPNVRISKIALVYTQAPSKSPNGEVIGTFEPVVP